MIHTKLFTYKIAKVRRVNIDYKNFYYKMDSHGYLFKQNLDYKILINAFSRTHLIQNLSSSV